ncbi:nicotinate-nucleotide--dimethylbenzimidazole phosphoribosyltransferase [Woodsholea maritima]|uniref:nicotinate-nucleotide--dimethylbenzimidazole phosphoribosyltransferase n=1 Tax=Woodsholea maritima TaxID=240237 RepID=UPI0003675516|nr:nicotinate-nucleotide--dimethylbenzimidazole phosphoribosyltransferase [Woodsholea maritima]
MLDSLPITPPNADLAARLDHALAIKTKPSGSLGQIEALARQIGLVQASLSPEVDPAHLLIFAGDHGLVESGVSAWPQSVTMQMVMNFLKGGAAANVFARTHGCGLSVVDAGVAHDFDPHPDLINAKIRPGTRNGLHEDAMSADEAQRALTAGAQLAQGLAAKGVKTLLLGEMGIGNTASASLIAHVLTGESLDQLTGRGAGLDDHGLKAKREILIACRARRPDVQTPIEALQAFGGFEIAMMAGAIIGGASAGMIVIIDGFIASAAALIALTARPDAHRFCVFAHHSAEPGHRAMLSALNAQPLLDLGLRLGEGTGGLLALPLLRASVAMLKDMATFEAASVDGASAPTA